MSERSIADDVLETFYSLHSHPELSYEEYETTKLLKKNLNKYGIEVLDLPLKTGLVATIGHGENTVAIRADIDALPVDEATDLAYKSTVKGKMHACGHDFHAATILGSAIKLKEHESKLRGTVKVIFQPAEEAPGGAAKVLETGVLDDVKAIFGIHTIPIYDVGVLAFREGATHAAVDKFTITFRGKGTHAAHPDLGVDTIVIAANFINAVQTVVSRNSNPFSSNLITIGHIEGGNTWNVVPESVFLEGTIRTMSKQDRELTKRRLVELASGIAASFGGSAQVEWLIGLPAMNNDKELTDFASELARSDGFKVERSPMSLGGEDFALYEEKIRGAFVQIGSGISLPNHNPKFYANPKAIIPASAFVAHLAQEALLRF